MGLMKRVTVSTQYLCNPNSIPLPERLVSHLTHLLEKKTLRSYRGELTVTFGFDLMKTFRLYSSGPRSRVHFTFMCDLNSSQKGERNV